MSVNDSCVRFQSLLSESVVAHPAHPLQFSATSHHPVLVFVASPSCPLYVFRVHGGPHSAAGHWYLMPMLQLLVRCDCNHAHPHSHDHPNGAAGAVSDAAAAPLINQNRTRKKNGQKQCLWFRTGFASNLKVSSSSRKGDPEHPAHETRCNLLLLLLLLLICAVVYWVCSTTHGTTPVYYKHPGVARNMCSTQRVLHCD